MGFFNFRLVKQFWRLILGTAFISSGLSYLKEGVSSAWPTLVLGCVLVIWHIIFLLRNKASRQK